MKLDLPFHQTTCQTRLRKNTHACTKTQVEFRTYASTVRHWSQSLNGVTIFFFQKTTLRKLALLTRLIMLLEYCSFFFTSHACHYVSVGHEYQWNGLCFWIFLGEDTHWPGRARTSWKHCNGDAMVQSLAAWDSLGGELHGTAARAASSPVGRAGNEKVCHFLSEIARYLC
jgi:hypothetical protein